MGKSNLMSNIVLYSKDSCSYCEQSKALLTVREIAFTELSLNKDFTREEILQLFPTARTFPIITINGEYIGRYNQLLEKIDNFLGKIQING